MKTKMIDTCPVCGYPVRHAYDGRKVRYWCMCDWRRAHNETLRGPVNSVDNRVRHKPYTARVRLGAEDL